MRTVKIKGEEFELEDKDAALIQAIQKLIQEVRRPK